MLVISSKRLRRTTALCVGLASLLIGLGLSYSGTSLDSIWLLGAVALLVFSWKIYVCRLVFAVLVMGLLGFLRGAAIHQELQEYKQYYGQHVTLAGVINDDPSFDTIRQQTTFTISNVRTNHKKLIGSVQVFTREEAAFSRGDSVVVSGKLKPTKGTTKQGIVIFSEITAHSNAQSYLESLRTRFFDSVRRALPEPHSSLGLGYLVGLRADIPKELSEQLSTTGLTHIIAVSGYNLTIIVQLVRRLLGKRSAYQSVVCAGLLLAGFLLVSGGSAPIIRASVVCGFSLVAWYYGRVFNPLVLLLLSGGITAFANPLYIWGDPGWYLSFLAFAGVLILAPLVVAHIYKNKTPNTIIHIFVETLCAQIATVPYSLYLFGGVSLIAPLANVLVLPFIPFIMFAVFITGITGMVLPVIAAYIGLIPSSLIALQTWIVQVLSTVSWAHRTVLITKTVMVALFITIVLLMLTLRRATRSDKVASWHDGLL